MENLDELILKAKNHDQNAMDQLLQRFKSKVIAISREYFLIGADFDDLIQEGMIGLYRAINVYDPNKNHNFSAFASLCIHRQLQNAVKNANRKKNSPLNSYLPIEYYGGVKTETDDKFSKLIIVDDNSDFEKQFIDNEMNAIMISKVKGILTDVQFNLLKMFLNGESYINMAKSLNVSTKQVDNMLQSIKKKLRTIKGEL
ncbi:MAG TPA: sigma-70 family RNA polymerase sigma factor [Candidatus Onthoplasma faecipullorum]|nr:sigma-70 family RNA polymerase sigma factor [Candidatus Onthoplasma faecipullorum]